MKRKMMAIFAVAAFIILSAVLIQAVDTDARQGDENDPKYIIGGSSTSKELRGGLEARISFNKTAFSSDAEVAFGVKLQSNQVDYSTVTIGSADLVKVASTGISVGVTALDAQVGVYAVKFKPNNDSLVGGTVLIKMTVTEKKDNATLEQHFYYAANISENTKVAFNVTGSAAEGYEYGPGIPGYPNPKTLKINYDQSVQLNLMMQEWTQNDWSLPTKNEYTFYGTDLPEGLSVTIDGYIGGKLDPTVSDNGTMTIHAVKNGLDTKLEIPYEIGQKPSDEPNFKFTVDNNETEYVMKKVNESITVKADNIQGKGVIKSYMVNADPSGVTDTQAQGVDKVWTVTGYPNAGTYIVTISAIMEYNGDAVTVQNTFTVYVVGGIYDGSLKPVVNPA